MNLKRKFGGRYNKIIKIAELKKVEQENRIIEEFVQEFRRTVRESEYKRRPLVEEFKMKMNRVMRWKIMKLECSLWNIEQWYERVVNLNRYWKESKRKEEKLRNRRKSGNLSLRMNMLANTSEVQWQ